MKGERAVYLYIHGTYYYIIFILMKGVGGGFEYSNSGRKCNSNKLRKR